MNQVVLLSNRSLFASGVQRLLQEVEGIDLRIVLVNEPDFATTLKHLNARVIVLDSGDLSIGDGAVAQVLRDCPDARVISLNLDATAIEVFEVRRIVQTSFEGLLQAIHSADRPT